MKGTNILLIEKTFLLSALTVPKQQVLVGGMGSTSWSTFPGISVIKLFFQGR
jgi:hypothetical protein